jgi:hypothetical protein
MRKKTRKFIRTTKQFIEKAKKVHGNKYDYSLVNFKKLSDYVEIICPIHGVFKQKASYHLQGHGCKLCVKTGFKDHKKAILYYVAIDDGKYYKIGVTNRRVEERFLKEEFERMEIIKTWHYDKGLDAYKKEQEILEKYKEHRYFNSSLITAGNTEVFNKDVLELDTKAYKGYRVFGKIYNLLEELEPTIDKDFIIIGSHLFNFVEKPYYTICMQNFNKYMKKFQPEIRKKIEPTIDWLIKNNLIEIKLNRLILTDNMKSIINDSPFFPYIRKLEKVIITLPKRAIIKGEYTDYKRWIDKEIAIEVAFNIGSTEIPIEINYIDYYDEINDYFETEYYSEGIIDIEKEFNISMKDLLEFYKTHLMK